ncbi:hypothetical protein C8Q70DRAFT_94381 [Cubamyces menziesii]|nr:hypothetical protein C8Q70DRAFT_94381 [Cubamyces menziesii]
MAKQAELASLKSYVNTLSSQPVVYGNSYRGYMRLLWILIRWCNSSQCLTTPGTTCRGVCIHRYVCATSFVSPFPGPVPRCANQPPANYCNVLYRFSSNPSLCGVYPQCPVRRYRCAIQAQLAGVPGVLPLDARW